MATTRVTSSFITREFAEIFHSRCHLLKCVDHSWNKFFGKSFGPVGKSGATVAIRKPALGTVRSGWQMDQGDITESSVNLTIDTVTGLDLNFSDADMALSIEDFSERYIVPNAMKAASSVDKLIGQYIYQNTFNYVPSTAFGTAPNASSYFLSAAQKIKENLVPMDGPINAVISPRTEAAMVGALAGQYNPSGNISEMYEKGQMAKALGMDWYMSQTLPAHTHGTCTTGTSPAVSGYTSSTMTVSNMTSGGTLTVGDTFTVSNVYAINRETKQTYGSLQQFVVTATTTGSGTNITVAVSPSVTTSGPQQTVSAAPTGGTVVLAQTTSGQIAQQDLVIHDKAFAVAFADLELPGQFKMESMISMDGITFRFLRGYDISNARFLSRMDAFWGIVGVRPEWSCRVIS
jgi:hypothetical protein